MKVNGGGSGRPPLVLYIAGPYRGDVERNIQRAREAALAVWRLGHVALCPHANSGGMDGAVPDEWFLEGGLALLERCDGLVLLPGWAHSSGTLAELRRAVQMGMPVWHWPEAMPEAARAL